MEKIILFWFRRDLRLQDNCGLYHALKSGRKVLPIFIFDRAILDDLENKKDPRLTFIHQELTKINTSLQQHGTSLQSYYGHPEEVFKQLLSQYSIDSVYTNRDYEPYARERDLAVQTLLAEHQVDFFSFKDQVIFEPHEVLKKDGSPYLVYTPYSKKWLEAVQPEKLESFPSDELHECWMSCKKKNIHSLESMNFQESKVSFPGRNLNTTTLLNYESERNIPAKDSSSKLGLHLRFGTLSIRAICRQASKFSLVFYKELIWREFFMMILYHFPHVVDQNYNAKYDAVPWRNKPDEFEQWKAGKTGYPIVDAGMRELNETGFMHNRVRMVVASFLCKHLLIDWKWGEAYFAEKLLDYELSSNNGNWQWCAGTGVDAAPYFRVFNPTAQQERFDSQKEYIKRWVPEIDTSDYPEPMVEHKSARTRAIDTYKTALNA